jgi:hypothetical protein
LGNARRAALLHPNVAGVGKNIGLVPMQQGTRLGDIADVGRRADHRVDQAGVCIRADVGLHATSGPAARAGRHACGGAKAQALACAYAHKVPLVALLRLVHVGVTLPLPVLGRGGRSDDRGVHHSPLTHEQALLGQVGVDGVEDGFRQPLLFQQAPELEQRGRIRRRLAG